MSTCVPGPVSASVLLLWHQQTFVPSLVHELRVLILLYSFVCRDLCSQPRGGSVTVVACGSHAFQRSDPVVSLCDHSCRGLKSLYFGEALMLLCQLMPVRRRAVVISCGDVPRGLRGMMSTRPCSWKTSWAMCTLVSFWLYSIAPIDACHRENNSAVLWPRVSCSQVQNTKDSGMVRKTTINSYSDGSPPLYMLVDQHV